MDESLKNTVRYAVGHGWIGYSCLYLKEDGDYSTDVGRAILFSSRKDLVQHVKDKKVSKIKVYEAKNFFIEKLMFDGKGSRTSFSDGLIRKDSEWVKYNDE